jgi:hypothetical protein
VLLTQQQQQHHHQTALPCCCCHVLYQLLAPAAAAASAAQAGEWGLLTLLLCHCCLMQKQRQQQQQQLLLASFSYQQIHLRQQTLEQGRQQAALAWAVHCCWGLAHRCCPTLQQVAWLPGAYPMQQALQAQACLLLLVRPGWLRTTS